MNGVNEKKEILAMYDIRGIQDYIFKTNNLKEIIGASKIVDNIIMDALKAFVDDYVESGQTDNERELYFLEWNSEDKEKFKNRKKMLEVEHDGVKKSIKMRTLFVGGGNGYVLYSDNDVCENANKFISKYVLENTYSLRVAVAKVDKTDNYKKDYERLIIKMQDNKRNMLCSLPIGAFPFAMTDSITGYPIVNIKDGLCTEASLKRRAYEKLKEGSNSGEKEFDKIKGGDSMLALVCMDGNNMGQRIIESMSHFGEEYNDAIEGMRNLSARVDKTFKESFKSMEVWIDNHAKSKTNPKKYRKIILAGDDICFVCNANLALSAVKHFLATLNKQDVSFMEITDDLYDVKANSFSACAGVAFFNSHFPFSDAYKVAEACCENAKKMSKCKDFNNTEDYEELIGNFIDFQICSNVNASNLDAYRDKHYKIGNDLIINRPYYVDMYDKEENNNEEYNETLNERYSKHSIENLERKIRILKGPNIPRSIAKELREVIVQGDNEIEKEISYLNSRKIYLDVEHQNNNTLKEERAIWYDACELMDIWNPEEGKANE